MPQSIPSFRDVLRLGRSIDLLLPDGRLVEDACLRAQEASEPWLFNNVVRSWLYSVRLAQVRSLSPDQELLAVAVLLHDLGLTSEFRADRRFEVTGADLGREFAMQRGMNEQRVEVLWDAIALAVEDFQSSRRSLSQGKII